MSIKNYTEKNLKSQEKKARENMSNEVLSNVTEKKILSEVFFDYMKQLREEKVISQAKIDAVNYCGTFLKFLSNQDRSFFSLSTGNFCNDRMCPICSWRLARKTAVILLELLEYARVKLKKEFIFLTLTAPNVSKEKLIDEITDFNKSFKRLSETLAFKKISLGYIRKLEITYNKKENTYHPHFHIIIAVNKSYFKKEDYISRQKWLAMWQTAKRDENITQVDVKKIKMESIKEVFEIATYSTKQKQLLSDFEVFKTLRSALKSRRIIVYNGLFRELKKLRDEGLLELDELENLKDLEMLADRQIYYKWLEDVKSYEELKEVELSEEDFKRIYNIDFSGLED